MILKIDQAGKGDYRTFTEAFQNLPAGEEEIEIHVAPGIYEERLNLKRNHVTLLGEDARTTVITGHEYAFRDHEDGQKVGTFRTATFMADCDYFTAKNITFENSAGQGSQVGQALALYADGQHQVYENCRMLGYQDTIFTAPLPLKEKQKNGFLGEKQFAPRRPGSQRFLHCRIEGNVDYIFGGADAVFEDCTLFTRKRDEEGKTCFVTAASTPEGQEFGYVFKNCRFLSDAPKGTVYLGRPWREFAKTVIVTSEMDESIAEAGYQDWNKPHETITYAEWHNFGPGASDKRADYAIMLTDAEAEKYLKH